ncbi:MAG: VWA domain-containing protein [Chloroflexi bacterium]|nr:VWA domain-containing protein [Chloroflexota bacterium]
MKKFCRHFTLTALLFVLFLTACGGSDEAAIEETTDTDTSAVDEATDSESVTDSGISASGSEEDSGSLPPTPEPGSKVTITRSSTTGADSPETAVATPVNRIETQTTASQIDIVLLIDASGSMSKELNHLKTGLDMIANQLETLPDSITLRYGFVIYRDPEKTNGSQIFNLTDNWSLFSDNLLLVTAVGGGDYAEDLNDGLHQAVQSMNWQTDATVKLIILLGDAPPHLHDPEAIPTDETARLAAEQNITIFTIGSDGLNEQGEVIYRQIAQMSNGRFIHITTSPESSQTISDTVYETADLPIAIIDIVQEVLNEQLP